MQNGNKVLGNLHPYAFENFLHMSPNDRVHLYNIKSATFAVTHLYALVVTSQMYNREVIPI